MASRSSGRIGTTLCFLSAYCPPRAMRVTVNRGPLRSRSGLAASTYFEPTA